MPNDENNLTTAGQTQSNPVNLGDTNPETDFDFNFDVSEPVSQGEEGADTNSSASSTMAGLSSSVQSQIQRQGRSGMFLTPDEEIQKGHSAPLQMDNLDFSSPELQSKTGMFTSTDDNSLVSSSEKDHGYADDDSYLATIEPSTTGVVTEESHIDSAKEKEPELDPELLDFMSFDDEKAPQNENIVQSEPIPQSESDLESGNEILASNPLDLGDSFKSNGSLMNPNSPIKTDETQDPLASSNEPENGVENDQVNTENNLSVSESSSQGPTDDRLVKEDQLVQDHFGDDGVEKEIEGQLDINKSAQETMQAVQDVVMDNPDNVKGIGNGSQMDGPLLQTENHGDDVMTDGNGYVVSDTGNIDSKSDSYVPNEDDFQNMSSLLNSSGTGEVDMSKMADNSSEISPIEAQMTQNIQENSGVNLDKMLSNNFEVSANTETQASEPLQQDVSCESQVLPIQQEAMTQPVSQESIIPTNVSEQADTQSEVQPLNLSDAVLHNVPNNSIPDQNNSINLDDIQISGESAENKDQITSDVSSPDQSVGGPLEFISNPQMISDMSLTSKSKKKNPFLFVGMAVIFVLLGAIVLFKMFPDFFGNFNNTTQGNPDLHYSPNSNMSGDLSEDLGIIDDQGLNGDENMDNDTDNDTESVSDDMTENDDQGQSGDVDPNSISALLDGENQTTESSDNQDIPSSTENNDRVDDSDQNLDENINPFGELDETLFGDNEYVQQMTNYVFSGQYYFDIAQQMGNEGLQRYATFVIEQANSQLSNLEKGMEIDTSIVEKMDVILNKLEAKIQGQ